jgi:hypothetical protein
MYIYMNLHMYFKLIRLATSVPILIRFACNVISYTQAFSAVLVRMYLT